MKFKKKKSFSFWEIELNSLNKFGHVEQCESSSRSANTTDAEEKVSWCKIVLNASQKLFESVRNGAKCSG